MQRAVEVVIEEKSLEAPCRSKCVGALNFEAAGVPWDVIGKVKRLWAVSDDPILVGTQPRVYQRHETIQGVTCVSRTFRCQVTIRAEGERVGTAARTRTDVVKRVPDSLTPGELEVLPPISGGLSSLLIRERSIG